MSVVSSSASPSPNRSECSCDEHDSSSMESDSGAPTTPPPTTAAAADRVPCQICRLQRSAVVYFNVPVCSGRSVKKAKSYQCLNSRLCGKNLLVPNRRVCKRCRFDRCVRAGMLEAKVRLQNRLGELTRIQQQQHKSNVERKASDSSEESAEEAGAGDVLQQFLQLRQRIVCERFRLYGNSLEPRPSPGGEHDVRVGLNEYALFNRIVRSGGSLFAPIDEEDWTTLSLFEYSTCWSVTEQVALTVRNFGHELDRVYNLDCSFNPLTVEHARQHWQFAFPLISSEDRTAIYELTVEYLHRVQLTMTQNVGLPLAKADLDDVEMAALHLLLMTRPACSEVVKPATKEYLQWLRNQTLSSLAAYLEAGTKNVDERMGQIIFLITDFQNLCRLVKHAMRLLMVATDYQASPPEFVELFRESISFLTRYAVF